jgi:hypothetical protein
MKESCNAQVRVAMSVFDPMALGLPKGQTNAIASNLGTMSGTQKNSGQLKFVETHDPGLVWQRQCCATAQVSVILPTQMGWTIVYF